MTKGIFNYLIDLYNNFMYKQNKRKLLFKRIEISNSWKNPEEKQDHLAKHFCSLFTKNQICHQPVEQKDPLPINQTKQKLRCPKSAFQKEKKNKNQSIQNLQHSQRIQTVDKTSHQIISCSPPTRISSMNFQVDSRVRKMRSPPSSLMTLYTQTNAGSHFMASYQHPGFVQQKTQNAEPCPFQSEFNPSQSGFEHKSLKKYKSLDQLQIQTTKSLVNSTIDELPMQTKESSVFIDFFHMSGDFYRGTSKNVI